MCDFKYDIVDKKIIVHEGVQRIPECAFENFDDIEEVVLPDSVTCIERQAFSNCTNLKKINFPKYLFEIENGAFEFCTSLEEITIPQYMEYISEDVFCNCINLKKVNINGDIKCIMSGAFQNCKKLQEIKLPDSIENIMDYAFYRCESIKEIHIPKNCENIEPVAFAYMSSLEKITVDENNNFYNSDKNNTMLIKNYTLIQYAIGSKYREVYLDKLRNCSEDDKIVDSEIEINYLEKYAFAGAKNLEKLYIPCDMHKICENAFENCENLKYLYVMDNYFKIFNPFIQTKNNSYYFPFENIEFNDEIHHIYGDQNLFKNAKNVKLPNNLKSIETYVFSKADNLKKIKIPNSIEEMNSKINENTNIIFDGIEPIAGNNFKCLRSKNNVKAIYLNDGNFYVIINNNPLKMSKEEIIFLTKSKIHEYHPINLILYLINILKLNNNKEASINIENLCKNEKLKELFIKFRTDPSYIEDISNNNFNKAIKDLLSVENKYKENLFISTFITNATIDKTYDEIEYIAKNYNESLDRILRFNDNKCKWDDKSLSQIILMNLIEYSNLLEKYKKYDTFLYNTIFIENLTIKNQELLIKHFNKNIKRLMLKSKFLNIESYNSINDLINMCNILGVFSDNERLSQKMSTFIIEKLMESHINLDDDKIHSIFDSINPRDEIDYEFIEFFIDNYKELFNLEINQSGIISRIYNNFREISSTSFSNRGNGRHLKVTLDKCMEYFAFKEFNNVNEKNKELALFLQKYYSESDSLNIAERILEESKKAPRNIFVNDNNPCNDLKEELSDTYSFEWLPKQDFDNLVLGKHCNCCAHIQGAGQGIMRASMILDNCQNLVVKDDKGKIISKATIYVNKKDGYAVFNTIETSLAYRSEEDLKKIYKAILRGTKAFIEEYNKNNIHNKIKTISVGTNRNSLLSYLDDNNHPKISGNFAINFGSYSLNGYGYSGDWRSQKLLLKI